MKLTSRNNANSNRKRSMLRQPPSPSQKEAPPAAASTSFMSCFVGEAQSTKVSPVQTHLLGDNCFCPKTACRGIVHVEEIDRSLTAPCTDIPVYSLELRRVVKCDKCSYVSSLAAHKLHSQHGRGRLPVVKLHRPITPSTMDQSTTSLATVTPTEVTHPQHNLSHREAYYQQRQEKIESIESLIRQRNDLSKKHKHKNIPTRGRSKRRPTTDSKPKIRIATDNVVGQENSIALSPVHVIKRDYNKETPKRSNISGDKDTPPQVPSQPPAIDKLSEEEEIGIMERLIQKIKMIGSGEWDTAEGDHQQHQQQAPQSLLKAAQSSSPRKGNTTGPSEKLQTNGDRTKSSALRNTPQGKDQQPAKSWSRKQKPSSPRHISPRRKDPPNVGDETSEDAPSMMDEFDYDDEGYSPRITFDRLHPPQQSSTPEKGGEPSDLIQYLAKQASANYNANARHSTHTKSVVQGPAIPAETCQDPPMNDPPYYYHNNSRPIHQEPKGSRYRQPKGRRKQSAPSLSSRLENPNRVQKTRVAQEETRYPSPTTRQRQRPGHDDQIRQVREDAPTQDYSYEPATNATRQHHRHHHHLTKPVMKSHHHDHCQDPNDNSYSYDYGSPLPNDNDCYSDSPEILYASPRCDFPSYAPATTSARRNHASPGMEGVRDRSAEHRHPYPKQQRRDTRNDRGYPSKISMTRTQHNLMSLPAVSPSQHLATVDLPTISNSDKALDDVIQESIKVLKETIPGTQHQIWSPNTMLDVPELFSGSSRGRSGYRGDVGSEW